MSDVFLLCGETRLAASSSFLSLCFSGDLKSVVETMETLVTSRKLIGVPQHPFVALQESYSTNQPVSDVPQTKLNFLVVKLSSEWHGEPFRE